MAPSWESVQGLIIDDWLDFTLEMDWNFMIMLLSVILQYSGKFHKYGWRKRVFS